MNRKPEHAPQAALHTDGASPWIRRFAPLVPEQGRVLDLAAGGGRHSLLFLERGCRVVAVDRDVSALLPFKDRIEIIETDLEDGAGWSLGSGWDGIVVTNYLHRPLLPALAAALAPGGVVLYETFAIGNERFGRPANPDFLLRPGELLAAFSGLLIAGFEQGIVETPRHAAIQRIAAVNSQMLTILPPHLPG